MSILDEALERQLRKILPKPKSVNPAPFVAVTPKKFTPANQKGIHLVYQEGSSDKEYLVQIVKVGSTGTSVHNQFEVHFQYGRRGGTLQRGTKTAYPVSMTEALNIYYKLVQEKKAKGYKEI